MAEPEEPSASDDTDLAQFATDYILRQRSQLKASLGAGQRGTDIAAAHALGFDGLFQKLFVESGRRLLPTEGALARVALIAVGGYGRGLVAPHSDVDVLFLSEDKPSPQVIDLAEAVLYPLWDAGVDVGHAVRGLEETLDLSRTDIRTSTTLLDVRHVAGDASLTRALVERGRAEIIEHSLEDFFQALVTDTEGRHERYGGTLYLREPELKWGRGGLRDLDVISWITRARWPVSRLEELTEAGALTDREWSDLKAAREHLWSVRNHLHAQARRRQDRLTFDDQEQVAIKLGYHTGVTLAVEQFMQAHYRHARVIARLVDIMAERAQRSRRPPPATIRDLGDGLIVHDNYVVMDDGMLFVDPTVALRLFSAALREGLPPEPRSRDAVAAVATGRDWCQALRKSTNAAPTFLALVSEAKRAPMRRASTLEALSELGLLLAMVPEFEPVMGRVPYDAYFAYTADVQAVKSVDKLRALERGEFSAEYHTASRCAAEMPRPIPLYLALLLHSIGAGHPDDPAAYAAAVARPIAVRLGLAERAVDHVCWLIENQATFYHCAMRRDITDPETIADLAAQCDTVYRLRDLYLLTFCIVATANPNAMTAWNARMLKDLWVAARDHIENGDNREQQLERLAAEALEGVDDAEERKRIEAFVAEMPERYLLANTPEGIRYHAQVAEREGQAPSIAATPSGVGTGTLELVVVTDDRPGLLADLAAALTRSRFNVDSAQLYTRERAAGRTEAFDLFHVTHPSATSRADVETELANLRQNIEAVLEGRVTAASLVAGRGQAPSWARSGPRIKTDIHVDNEASSQYTVVDVYTRDRAALLYTIAQTLRRYGLSIALAKVNTEGDRAADVFYVEQEGGGKLASEGAFSDLVGVLRRAIHALDKDS